MAITFHSKKELLAHTVIVAVLLYYSWVLAVAYIICCFIAKWIIVAAAKIIAQLISAILTAILIIPLSALFSAVFRAPTKRKHGDHQGGGTLSRSIELLLSIFYFPLTITKMFSKYEKEEEDKSIQSAVY